jgi:hypothetical protein
MMEATSGMKSGGVAIGWGEQKTKMSWRDYVVDVGCWIIDAVVKAFTFVISGAIFMVEGAAFFVCELIFKIILGVMMLFLTCWLLGAVLKICWMIWGPKNL